MKKVTFFTLILLLSFGFLLKQGPAQDWEHVETLTGHRKSVFSVAFSPNGQILASASSDNTVRLWNPNTGQETATLIGHTRPVQSVAFSPNGQILASAGRDNTIRLWNLNTGQTIRELNEHTDHVFSVAFSPNGQFLASASKDNTIRLWNLNTGQNIRTLKRHTDHVFSVAFSPNGQILASASRDNTIRLWNPNTGQNIRTLNEHTDHVFSVAFSPNGRILASASRDNTVRLWNPNTGRNIDTLDDHTNHVYGVAFSPDGRILASGSYDDTVRLYNPNTRRNIAILEGHRNNVQSIAFSPDRITIASGSWDNTVRLWRPAGAAPVSVREEPEKPVSNDPPPSGRGIDIPDPNLRRAIAKVLNKPANTPITQRDMEKLTGLLEAPHLSIADLTGLEFAVNLKALMIDFNNISDISPLRNLTSLITLDITTNPIVDISPLRNLTNLRTLQLSHQQLNDMAQLKNLTNLENLQLRDDDTGGLESLRGQELASVVGFTPTNDGATVISVEPAAVESPEVGEAFTVNINITGGAGTRSYDLTINFDPTALEYVAGRNANYLPGDTNSSLHVSASSLFDVFGSPQTTTIEDRISIHRLSKDRVAPDADGTLAVVTFRVVEAKPSTIGLEYVQIKDASFHRLKVTTLDGKVTVDDSVPRFVVVDPTTLAPGAPPPHLDAPTTPLLNFEYTTTFKHVRAVRALAFSPDGAFLASADGPPPPNTGFPTLNVWNTVNNERVLAVRTPLHRRAITSVAFSPDGRILASASVDGNICAWNPQTGQIFWYIENAHAGGVQSLSFSADSRRLVTGGRDNTVRLWNLSNQKLTNTLEGHTDWVLEVAISQDNLIASASRDQTIRLWNLRGNYLGSLRGHTDFVTSVGFAPTGELVSASRDMTIRSWNPQTRALLRIFEGHTDHVHQVAVHNPMIASPSADGTVRLWQLLRLLQPEGGEAFTGPNGIITLGGTQGFRWQPLTEHTDVVRIAAFSPNGLMLASGDESGNVILWRGQPVDLISTDPREREVVSRGSTVPHSIELVEDNRVVDRGLSYTPVFVVRNAAGDPLEGVEVKLRLGQWAFEPIRTTEIPIPSELESLRGIGFFRDDHPARRRGVVNVYGWRVQSDGSPSTATTDSKGVVVFSRRLFSEGKYGVSVTVLRNGQEFLTTSFSTAGTPNKEYIKPNSDVIGLENGSVFYRVSGGWKIEDVSNLEPVSYGSPPIHKHAPAYRVSVRQLLHVSCGVDPVHTTVGVGTLEKSRPRAGLTSGHIEQKVLGPERYFWLGKTFKWRESYIEWIDPQWTPADTVANESQDILILTVKFLNGSDDEIKAVEEAAVGWSDHANVKFDFLPKSDEKSPSDIRIKFHYDTGEVWGQSLIGRHPFVINFIRDNWRNPSKAAKRFNVSEKFVKAYGEALEADPPALATMDYYNLQDLIEEERENDRELKPDERKGLVRTRRLVLHEFGHALGFKHEQVNPKLFLPYDELPEDIKKGFQVKNKRFEWNEEVIKKEKYGDLSPEDQQVNFDNNFGELSRYTFAPEFDENSIMMYQIKAAWNTVGYRYDKLNTELSEKDKYYVGQYYGAPQPVIKLEGHVAIEGEIYEYTSGGVAKFFNIDNWERREFDENEPITVFVGAGNSAVKLPFRMHDDSKRTLALYLGAVRSTSEGISIARGAGFLNYDVSDANNYHKRKDFYGFTPCERTLLKWNTQTTVVFDTNANNDGGDVTGALEVVGMVIVLVAKATAGQLHIHYPYSPDLSPVEASCEFDPHISLKIDPNDVYNVHDAAADSAEVSLTLEASLFQTEDTSGFPKDSGTYAAPSVTVTDPDPTIPQITTLLPNYPNPFNPETWIPYHLAKPARVTLTIYAIDGKMVRHLDLGHQAAGYYHSKSRAAYWNGRNTVGERVASGIYFYTLMAGDFAATQKMLILK